MAKNLLILIFTKQEEALINRFRRASFEKTGDESIFALPSCVVLEETEKDRFERRSFSLPLRFEKHTTYIEGKHLFLLEKELREKIGYEKAGLFYSLNTPCLYAGPWEFKGAKLALLKWDKEGYFLLQ